MASSRQSEANLYSLAEKQHGFFTAGQAEAAGYHDNVHPYHVANGDWIRVWRGIYRLARYPEAVRSELMIAFLWSRNRRGISEGVFSHMTAMEIRGLAPPHTEVVHMTVPKTFRRNSKPPRGIIIHSDGIQDWDVEMLSGLQVTTMIRTLADLQACGVDVSAYEEQPAAAAPAAVRRVARVQPAARRIVPRPAVEKAAQAAEPSWGGARAW